jgi:hypothetical protein
MSGDPWFFEEKSRELKQRMADFCGKHGRTDFRIPFFGEIHTVSPVGVIDGKGCEAQPAVSVVLMEYLANGGGTSGQKRFKDEWISYRECRGAGPLMGYFQENTAKTLERTFAGNLEVLRMAARKIGAAAFEESGSFDISLLFHALPDIPLLLRFSDREEDFPASCQILFPRYAQDYLDIRCLGVIGTYLTGSLINL